MQEVIPCNNLCVQLICAEDTGVVTIHGLHAAIMLRPRGLIGTECIFSY